MSSANVTVYILRLNTSISVLVSEVAPAVAKANIAASPHQLANLIVRPGKTEDADQVLVIWNDAFAFTPAGGRQLLTKADFLAVLVGADLVVAEAEGQVSGTVTLLEPGAARASIAKEGEVEIGRLAVSLQAQRQGIARTLLEWTHGEGVRRGAKALVLACRADQFEARQLYDSLGYQHLSDRDLDEGRGEESLVYWLPLGRRGRTHAAIDAS
jgi:ribosomal protein S18 acetylase RimI-like enzyme